MNEPATICPYLLDRPHFGDALELARLLPDESVHCVVTSPPYWSLRDYSVDGQWGLEATPTEYVAHLVALFAELRRALRLDGTCWLNLGDTYYHGNGGSNAPGESQWASSRRHIAAGAFPIKNNPSRHLSQAEARKMGMKPKDMVGIPWTVALALRADGWWLRSDIIWEKTNAMYESAKNRPTRSHEYLFMLTRGESYWCDENIIHGLRTVWSIPTQPYSGTHYAAFPEALPSICIQAGCPPGGVVLDPFLGSGTTGQVAHRLGRRWLGFDLDKGNQDLIEKRTAQKRLL